MNQTGPGVLGPPAMFIGATGALCLAALAILGTEGFAARPDVIGPALTVDLALGLPLLGYLTLVRTGRADPLILAPLAVLGMLLARWWIPGAGDERGFTLLVVLLVEVFALGTLVVRSRAVVRAYRRERPRHPYRRDAIRAALAEVVGARAADAILGELEAFVYAVAGWRRPTAPAFGTSLPGHTRGGYPAILGGLLLAVAAETMAVHLVVVPRWPVAAWVLTGLSIYSAVWLVGDVLAGRHNPTLVTPDVVYLRTGLRWSLDLPRSGIARVVETAPDGASVDFVYFGAPDLWLECAEPVVVRGPFGLRRRTRLLGVGVDDPDALRALLVDPA